MQKKDPLKSKRIFVGFNSAGAVGIWNFTRVLKRRGYQIDFYGIKSTRYDMPVDFLLEFSKSPYRAFFERLFYFFKILPRYDIWHLNYMEVFFFYPLNLLILKLFRKKIICTFRGSEVRIGEEDGWTIFKKIIRMRLFCVLSDKIVLTGPFLVNSVAYYDKIIPYARDVRALVKTTNQSVKHKLVVLHAPSNLKIKGTFYVEKVFRNLQKSYPQVEFKIVQNLSHKGLLNEISRADIVVDQLLVGWYGGLAVEALMMGKTVIAFLNPDYFSYIDFALEMPVYNTNIWALERDLKMLLDHPRDLKRIGEEGSKFARKYHDSRKIAKQYLEIYRGTNE